MPNTQTAKINPVEPRVASLKIKGVSPMIQNRWGEKAVRMMQEKHAGKKTKNRDVRDPEQEFKDATHLTADGEYGIPAVALKASIINAAHVDSGIPKTLVRKALFIDCDDPNGVLPIKCSEPKIRQDCVRVGGSSTDLRYRPQFDEWSLDFSFQFDAELLTLQDIASLLTRAGFGVGLMEWRPEKGGDFGRFVLVQQ